MFGRVLPVWTLIAVVSGLATGASAASIRIGDVVASPGAVGVPVPVYVTPDVVGEEFQTLSLNIDLSPNSVPPITFSAGGHSFGASGDGAVGGILDGVLRLFSLPNDMFLLDTGNESMTVSLALDIDGVPLPSPGTGIPLPAGESLIGVIRVDIPAGATAAGGVVPVVDLQGDSVANDPQNPGTAIGISVQGGSITLPEPGSLAVLMAGSLLVLWPNRDGRRTARRRCAA